MIEPYYRNGLVTLYCGDCLDVMQDIALEFDACITDPPFAVTACKWDSVIPFDRMWKMLRCVKQDGAICLFGTEPFSSMLRCSNLKQFRYDWIWDKGRGSNFQNAHVNPMKCHENISVFYDKKPIYNPQYWYSKPYETTERKRGKKIEGLRDGSAPNICTATVSKDGRRFPLSILRFKRDGRRIHPTQKPVALMEYLIKTYTNENEFVLDFTCGSGTTGVACMRTNRGCVMIEKDENYCEIAKQRLIEEESKTELFNWSER